MARRLDGVRTVPRVDLADQVRWVGFRESKCKGLLCKGGPCPIQLLSMHNKRRGVGQVLDGLFGTLLREIWSLTKFQVPPAHFV